MRDLVKNKESLIEYKDIFNVVEDMLVYLEKGDKDEHVANQHIVEMLQFFRSYAVKVWKGVNFSNCECRNINKILIQHCVRHYKLR